MSAPVTPAITPPNMYDAMHANDAAYLNRPRPTHYCLRCGGWSDHRADCDADEVRMPWGRHKGKHIRDVPTSYLEWLIDAKQGALPDSFSLAIARLLNRPLRPKPPRELNVRQSLAPTKAKRPPRRGCKPCEGKDWCDTGHDSRGWIRTDCSRCGNFIGYRPPTLTNTQTAIEVESA